MNIIMINIMINAMTDIIMNLMTNITKSGLSRPRPPWLPALQIFGWLVAHFWKLMHGQTQETISNSLFGC